MDENTPIVQALRDAEQKLGACHDAINELAKTTGLVGPIGRHATVATERLGEAHYWCTMIVNYANSTVAERVDAAQAAGKLTMVQGGAAPANG